MLLIAVASLLGLARAQAGLGQCYFPSGEYASGHHPCNPHAYISQCCPTGWTCFSNNLCIITSPSVASSDSPVGTSSRGTCTDPQWNDSDCGSFCLDKKPANNNGALTPCGNGEWCCSSDVASGACDCTSGNGTFTVGSGTAVALVGVVNGKFTVTTGTAIPTSTGPIVKPSSLLTASKSSSASSDKSTSSSKTTSATKSTPTSSKKSTPTSSKKSTSTSSKKSASTSSTKSTTLRSSTLSSSTVPHSTASTSTTANSTITESSTGPSRKSLGLGIGLGLGLGLLLLLLALAWLWYRRRQARSRTDSPDPNQYLGIGTQVDHVGPPAGIGPTPNPYHSGHTAIAWSPAAEESGQGLTRIRHDLSGQPLVDPYALAAMRADSRLEKSPTMESVRSPAMESARRPTMESDRRIPRKPVPSTDSLL